MKDLTHYFLEPAKTCEASENNSNGVSEAANNVDKLMTSTTRAKRKRGRVKIKISQTNGRGRVCDIIESKNDLVDKTPSPFTASVDMGQIGSHDETPKRSTIVSRKGLLEMKDQTIDEAVESSPNIDDSFGETIFDAKKKISNASGVNDSMEPESGKREGSNAFQVMMTRNKPVVYVSPKQLTPEEEVVEVQKTLEVKTKTKQVKEKLVALADKKGYSKRKLIEAEEGEKIDKVLENRAKVFKKLRRDEGGNSPPSQNQVQNQRTSIGGLHNYFSKVTPEERERERLLSISTLIVKADIHGAESFTPTSKLPGKPKSVTKVTKSRMRKVLATIDDIQVLRSETPSPPPEILNETVVVPKEEPSKKFKWSLRINLSSVDTADEGGPGDEKEEEDRALQKPRAKDKKRKKQDNRKAIENESQCDDKKIELQRKKSPELEEVEQLAELTTDDFIPRNRNESITILETDLNDSTEIFNVPKVNPEVIEVKYNEKKSSDVCIVVKEQKKLAPLFMKRQKPDRELLAARRRFLNSRPPENPKKKIESKTPVFNGSPILPFPEISHITQLKIEENIEPLPPSVRTLPMKKPSPHIPNLDVLDFRSLTSLNTPEVKSNLSKSEELLEIDQEDVLLEIESRCKDARDLWREISRANEQSSPKITPKKRGRKRKSCERKENPAKEEKNTKNETWIKKYRPLSASQIVGNEEAAMKLKNWLEGWKKPSEKCDYSSGDEFYSSDNSVSSSFEIGQVAVLLGPHGTGKTASVYAIAEELGYKILEVNASSKRPGRKILKDFEEATQSHRIKKSDSQLFNQKLLEANEKIPQNSLILVEDVDLVFDEDEGFVSAICQIASNTKRPIVMTSRESHAQLARMAPQQMKITFCSTVGSRVSALLELITLAESRTRIPKNCIDKLLVGGDLRRALLQLQYLLAAGISSVPTDAVKFGETLWQDMRHYLYKPIVKADKKQSKKKGKQKELETVENPVNGDIIAKLANDLDTVLLSSSLVDIDDETLNISRLKFEPSLSLEEDTSMYSRNDVLSEEIAIWLTDQAFSRHTENVKASERQNSSQLLLVKKELNMGVDLALSHITPYNLDSQGIAIDYLPAARTICRAEELKSTNNGKRGNRFFHYLLNFRMPATSTKPNILTAACKIMYDKEIGKSDN